MKLPLYRVAYRVTADLEAFIEAETAEDATTAVRADNDLNIHETVLCVYEAKIIGEIYEANDDGSK